MKKKFLLVLPLMAIVLMGAGCDLTSATTSQGSYKADAVSVEQTQKRVQAAVPIPQLVTSAERKNIAKRAEAFDTENKITYIYLISYGRVMSFYTVEGKVSSLNSYLTPLDKLVNDRGEPCTHMTSGQDNSGCYVVSSPDIDGAYGENADGIFFFTTEGVYIEWKGDYMVSDEPLKLTEQPALVRTVK